jgi:hypothetical protein
LWPRFGRTEAADGFEVGAATVQNGAGVLDRVPVTVSGVIQLVVNVNAPRFVGATRILSGVITAFSYRFRYWLALYNLSASFANIG